MDNYKNPQNFGDLLDANAIIVLENTNCGDKVKIQLKIENEVISDVKFDGEGCAVSIASASILTEHIKGKKVSEVEEMRLEDLLKLIGVQLTVSRLKCANLGLEATKKAISEHK